MAQPARNIWGPEPATEPLPVPPAGAIATPIGDGSVAWSESPARLLHDRLVATFVTPAAAPLPAGPVLSPRAKLGIVLGASAALWSLIGLAVTALR